MTNNIESLANYRKPVTYTIIITHHWDGKIEVFVQDIADDERSREAVGYALSLAADAFGGHASIDSATPADAEAHLTALLRAEYERGVREAAAKMAEPAMLGLTLTKMEQSILALLTQKGK